MLSTKGKLFYVVQKYITWLVYNPFIDANLIDHDLFKDVFLQVTIMHNF